MHRSVVCAVYIDASVTEFAPLWCRTLPVLSHLSRSNDILRSPPRILLSFTFAFPFPSFLSVFVFSNQFNDFCAVCVRARTFFLYIPWDCTYDIFNIYLSCARDSEAYQWTTHLNLFKKKTKKKKKDTMKKTLRISLGIALCSIILFFCGGKWLAKACYWERYGAFVCVQVIGKDTTNFIYCDFSS